MKKYFLIKKGDEIIFLNKDLYQDFYSVTISGEQKNYTFLNTDTQDGLGLTPNLLIDENGEVDTKRGINVGVLNNPDLFVSLEYIDNSLLVKYHDVQNSLERSFKIRFDKFSANDVEIGNAFGSLDPFFYQILNLNEEGRIPTDFSLKSGIFYFDNTQAIDDNLDLDRYIIFNAKENTFPFPNGFQLLMKYGEDALYVRFIKDGIFSGLIPLGGATNYPEKIKSLNGNNEFRIDDDGSTYHTQNDVVVSKVSSSSSGVEFQLNSITSDELFSIRRGVNDTDELTINRKGSGDITIQDTNSNSFKIKMDGLGGVVLANPTSSDNSFYIGTPDIYKSVIITNVDDLIPTGFYRWNGDIDGITTMWLIQNIVSDYDSVTGRYKRRQKALNPEGDEIYTRYFDVSSGTWQLWNKIYPSTSNGGSILPFSMLNYVNMDNDMFVWSSIIDDVDNVNFEFITSGTDILGYRVLQDGVYEFSSYVELSQNTGNQYQWSFYGDINKTAYTGAFNKIYYTDLGKSYSYVLNTPIPLNANDEVYLYFHSDYGYTMTITSQANSYFSVKRIK